MEKLQIKAKHILLTTICSLAQVFRRQADHLRLSKQGRIASDQIYSKIQPCLVFKGRSGLPPDVGRALRPDEKDGGWKGIWKKGKKSIW